jgi:hypothetical protein
MNILLTPAQVAEFLGVTSGTLSVWRFFKRDDQLIRLLYQYKKQCNIRFDNQNFGNPYVDNKGQGISLHFVVLAQQEKMREMLRMQRESVLN